MADYSSFIFNSLANVGNGIRQNRQDAREQAIQDRNYSRLLGLDAYGQGQDAIQNAQRDRALDIQEQSARSLADYRAAGGAAANKAPAGYRWTMDGNLEAIPGGPAAAGRTANAPVGYRWAGDVLEPIPGGPAEKLPAELSARVGMAENYLRPDNINPMMEGIKAGEATGPIDWAMGKVGYGKSGEIQRNLASGVDALRRMLTGAGMNMAEAEEYLSRYQPRMTDTAEILASKVSRLNDELAAISRNVQKGRQPAGQQNANPGNPYAPPPVNSGIPDPIETIEGDVDAESIIREAEEAIRMGADPNAVREELIGKYGIAF